MLVLVFKIPLRYPLILYVLKNLSKSFGELPLRGNVVLLVLIDNCIVSIVDVYVLFTLNRVLILINLANKQMLPFSISKECSSL